MGVSGLNKIQGLNGTPLAGEPKVSDENEASTTKKFNETETVYDTIKIETDLDFLTVFTKDEKPPANQCDYPRVFKEHLRF